MLLKGWGRVLRLLRLLGKVTHQSFKSPIASKPIKWGIDDYAWVGLHPLRSFLLSRVRLCNIGNWSKRDFTMNFYIEILRYNRLKIQFLDTPPPPPSAAKKKMARKNNRNKVLQQCQSEMYNCTLTPLKFCLGTLSPSKWSSFFQYFKKCFICSQKPLARAVKSWIYDCLVHKIDKCQ